ncbi:MAG TPA: PA0069 family radical SAM protein [Solimonas sp.]|nr:PA0069 family radical SAM protein [Solimonas sp.]
MSHPGPEAIKTRGAASNPEGRFETRSREDFDDGWLLDEPETPRPDTTVTPESSRSIISRNQSPDIGFEQSINPYRGCEHGCIYCYARPAHAYMNLSPGLDFETRLFYKPNAAGLLEAELRKPGYKCSPIALGSNTDPYQPVEREYRVTRSILEVLQRCRHPVTITTKGAALVERDIPLLAEMARDNLVEVAISITSLQAELKRALEPRASGPRTRLRVMRQLAEAGVPVMVLVAPVIPFVNDHEIEQILQAAKEAGAREAAYIMLRLPYEVKQLFREWLQVHHPQRAEHVMSLVQQMRGGKDNDPRFGLRMTGQGEYAQVLAQRFKLAVSRLGLGRNRRLLLNTALFRSPPPPLPEKGQLGLGF